MTPGGEADGPKKNGLVGVMGGLSEAGIGGTEGRPPVATMIRER